MIISVDEVNVFDKIQHPFIIKKIQQTRNKTELHQADKGHLKNL